MMSAAAWFPTPQRSPRQAAVQRSRVPAIPADAAEWLRAHFDWTFGAVWVASERWQVPAETVVVWAEKLQAGGARAGLSTKERTWICKQLSDPERQPTAAERAMARAAYLWNDPAAEGPIGPVAINGIDDAIALIEARLADDGTDRTTRDARELRELLLDDLRVLRDGQRSGPVSGAAESTERSDDEMSIPVHVDELPDMAASVAINQTIQGSAAPEPEAEKDDKGYRIRDAQCLTCGKPFKARLYPRLGWASYCSASCGAKGRYAHKANQTTQKTTVARGEIIEPEQAATAAPTEPPTLPEQLVGPSEPVRLHVAVAPVSDAADADDADDTEADGGDDITPQLTPEREPSSKPTSANGWDGLVALWKLLTQSTAQPPLGSQIAPVVPGWLLTGGIGGNPATWRPATPPAPEASSDDDSLLDAFLDRLPGAKTWTLRERERWLRAFTATLDLEIAVSDEQPGQMQEGRA